MTRLTRADLINWADTKQSEGLLPELIRRLVIASNHSVESIVMPYGDSVGRSGLDGHVRATATSTYVTTGESVWEIGTNKDHVSKANNDFKKRTAGTAKFRQQELTYQFVTPRHWEKKAEWIIEPGPANKKVTSHWAEVRVYDVDDLLGWLTDCPSVEAWFSRKLGKATAGLRDVDGYWQNVAKSDTGIIESHVLLAGREESVQQVQSHFANEGACPKPLAVLSRSPAEVVPFAVASIIDSGNEAAIARTVVIDSRNRWEQLIVEESGLGLIVTPQVQPTREELQQAFGRNHRIVYCSETGDLRLPRLSEFEIRQALIASGVGEGEATQHAKQCGGNGQILLDRLSGLHTPAGALGSSLDDRVKVACLLLVAWNGEHPADRQVVSLLSGMPYEDVEASLVSDSIDPEGLLFRVDGKFRLLSPELAWIRHAPLITKSVTDNYADVVRYLLADDDPTAGMSGDEVFTAQFLGIRREFSGTLRRNVVHSLAIAGSIGAPRLKLDPSMSPSFVEWIVRSTLEDATFSRWASLGGELSILAEASPDALLDALERDLEPGGPLQEVMDQTKTDLFRSPAHTGILWALERLCWAPQYLERAIYVLLRLVALNPDIQSGNNPSNSIQETLQLCHPQTSADWKTRQRAITRMLEEDCETAFEMIISLFPGYQSHWMVREKPTWRDWAFFYEGTVTYRQMATELRWCVEQLLLSAGQEPRRWSALLKLCGDIDDEQFDAVLDGYESNLKVDAFDDDAKRILWETINAMLVRLNWSASHLRLRNGDVIGQHEIEDQELESEPHFPREVHRLSRFGPRLQQLLNASIPEDPVLAGCHAFLGGSGNNHCSIHFPDRFDWQQQQELIEKTRISVVQTVIHSEGTDGLLRLAAIQDVDADAVGRTAAVSGENTGIDINEIIPLFSSTATTCRLFASGFTTVWAWERKDELSTKVLPLLSIISCEETTASFLQCLPLEPEVWNCVDAQDETIQRFYWKNAPLPWQVPEGRLLYLVDNLIQASRADRAIGLLARQSNVIPEDAAESVFNSLESLPLVVRDPDSPKRDGMHREIRDVFKVLYRIGMSQVERLVGLELLYHHVFAIDNMRAFQPKGVLSAIRDSPSLFVDLLSLAWKNDERESTTTDDVSTRRLANQVGGLLYNQGELPGQTDLCPMDEKTIAEWVAEVMRIAIARRYVRAANIQFARVIARRSWKSIDSWPTPQVVDAINVLTEVDPDGFREQLRSSLYNARGFHSVDPTGKSEEQKAEKWRKRADELQQFCPTAAWALRQIAQGLVSEAMRNVERAEWER